MSASGKKVRLFNRLFPTGRPVNQARKYLSNVREGWGIVRVCCIFRRFGNFPRTDIVMIVVAVPWFCIFIACGSGGVATVSSSPQTANTDEPASMPAVESEQPVPSHDTATRKSDNDLITEARVLAWELVEKHLKFPHDSRIGWGGDCKRLNDHSILATGTVKAANALGAKLTHDWRVVLAVNEQDQFMPMYISIGDEELLTASDDSLAVFLGRPTEAESQREAEFRTWHAESGDYSVRARLDRFRNDSVQGGVVTLEREDGTTVDVPIAKLAADDAEWARDEIKRRAATKRE